MIRKWREKYEQIEAIGGGGQGEAFIVRAKAGGETLFLKALKQQNDLIRRARMHREVEAYRTLKHNRIPALIDSNTREFENLDFKLFLTTELIDGKTLGAWTNRHGPLGPAHAVALTEALLDAVDHCHQNQVVHRDIKPDNIVLRNSSPTDPVLVDFGLSFDESAETFGTLHEEELGNRFLRLPELAPYSANKRDPRSDLTFVAGVLLYALTGTAPAVLVDAQGRLPHQRPEPKSAIQGLLDPYATKLNAFFDRSFQYNVDHRWQTVQEIRAAVSALLHAYAAPTSVDEKLAQLRARLSTPHIADAALVAERLRIALDLIHAEKQKLQAEVANRLDDVQTGYEVDIVRRMGKNQLALVPKGSPALDFVLFEVAAVGDELVFSGSYKGERLDGFYRCNLAAPTATDALEQGVRSLFLTQISDVV